MTTDTLIDNTNLVPQVLKQLTAYFAMLPGIGRKTATRLAYYMILNFPESEQKQLGELIKTISKNIKKCSFCNVVSDTDPCSVCANTTRDNLVLLVVESSLDVYKIEQIGGYKGIYYVLEDDTEYKTQMKSKDYEYVDRTIIKKLTRRVCNLVKQLKKGQKLEVIFGLPIDIKNQGIINLLKDKLIEKCGEKIKFSRLAVGMSIGADIDFVDPHTLLSAISNRQHLED